MYRTAAKIEKTYETLLAFDVRKAAHRNSVLACSAIAALASVIFVVDRAKGRPLTTGDVAIAVAAIVLALFAYGLHRDRRRSLRLLRHEAERRLVVEGGDVDLVFPLRIRGEQRSFQLRGSPSYHLFLQAIDADGRAVTLHAAVGALRRPIDEWLNDGVDAQRAGPDFDVPLARIFELRRHIEAINAEIATGE